MTEASLQHAIALKLAESGLCPNLEVPAPSGEKADIIFSKGATCWGIELKYKTRERLAGHCHFTYQGAQNNGGYDFLVDIERLEQWKSSGWFDNGCAVFVTNDYLYWHPTRAGAKSKDFRFPDGAQIHGEYVPEWKGRDTQGDIHIKGKYRVKWFTGTNPCGFRALMIFV